MKKKNIVYIVLIIVVLGISSLGINYWWTGTPKYSLQQLHGAVQNHNIDLAFQYIDYDKVFDGIWEEIVSKTLDVTKEDNLDLSIASINLMESNKSTIKIVQKQVMEKAISGENTEEIMFSKPTFTENIEKGEYTTSQYKDTFYVKFSSGMKLTFTKYEGRNWKIIKIDGLEITNNGKMGI